MPLRSLRAFFSPYSPHLCTRHSEDYTYGDNFSPYSTYHTTGGTLTSGGAQLSRWAPLLKDSPGYRTLLAT